MTADGQFLVECVHNCGHAVPPVDAPPGESQFAGDLGSSPFNHPYWLPAGQSPYLTSGAQGSAGMVRDRRNNAVRAQRRHLPDADRIPVRSDAGSTPSAIAIARTASIVSASAAVLSSR